MGDGASKPDDDTRKRPSAAELHEKFQKQRLDGKSAIEAAFADDPFAMQEIEKIVRQLEGLPPEDEGQRDVGEPVLMSAAREKATQRAKASEQKQANISHAAERTAEKIADGWLERQLAEGRAAEAAALAAKAAKAAEADVAAKEAAARDEAREEAAARARLWMSAEEAASRKCDTARRPSIIDSSIRSTARIFEPTEGADVPPPPPPTDMNRPSAKDALPLFYKLLGVGVDATFDEIKKAYRKQALKWHPDKNRDRLDEATEHFKKVTEAFDTLFDPERRAKYDSGAVQTKGKMKKLAGHGWKDLPDDSDEVLTVQGWKWKRQSWRGYVLMYGRIDDDPDQIVQDENDARAPAEKIKVFWRFLGEMAHIDRESEEDNWLSGFIEKVWKDTPSRWPKALELRGMSETAQHEWKERRMVFNRRKEKILLHVELHEQYLAIPNREKKEVERLMKRNPAFAKEFGMDDGSGKNAYRAGQPMSNAHLLRP